MDSILQLLQSNWVIQGGEFLLFSALAYVILRALRGTRGIIMLLVLLIPFTLLGYVAYFLNMDRLNNFVSNIYRFSPLILVILFQHEIRRFLAFIGSSKYLSFRRYCSAQRHKDILDTFDNIIDCVCALTKNKNWRMYINGPDSNRFKPKLTRENIGALIAIEKNVGLNDYIEQSGTPLNCHVNSLLLQTIFWPSSPLHDGGVIIRGTEIVAAGCQFPSSNMIKSETAHTRHNAAIGMAENSDAFVIVVSEETGTVSITTPDAQLRTVDSPKELLEFMMKHFEIVSDKNQKEYHSLWDKFVSFINKNLNEE